MGIEPSWSVLIAAHAVAASYALLLGPVQLARRRYGDRPHRIIGWSWTVAMAVTIVSSFFIVELNGFMFWFLHGLSVFTACTISLGVIQAARGRIASHRGNMIGSYLGLVGAFIGVVAIPTRRVDETAVHSPGPFWIAALIVGAAAAITVVVASRAPERRRA